MGPKTSFLMVFVDPAPIPTPTPSVFRATRSQNWSKPGNQTRNLKSGDRFIEGYTAFYVVFVMPMAK